MTQFVYFARCIGTVGPIKIGWSQCPEDRVLALSAWAPFPVEIIHTIPGDRLTERRVHAHFASLHSHREWFHAEPPLLDAIARLMDGEALSSVIDMSAKGTIRSPVIRYRTAAERARQSEVMKATWARKRAAAEKRSAA